MSDPNDGHDPPTSDHTTPEQQAQIQHHAVMGLLTTIQQDANDDRTAMRQFRDSVTRQLADPWAHIGSLTLSRRALRDSPGQEFDLSIYPPVDPGTSDDLDQRLDGRMRGYSLDQLYQIHAHVVSRIHAINGVPPQVPGSEGVPGSSQVINRDAPKDSDNTELQELRQSALKQSNRIKELKDALQRSQAHQSQNTTPNKPNPAQGPNNAQKANENDRAESSSAAQRRAQQSDAAPKPSATSSADIARNEAAARAIQEQIWAEESPDGDISQAELDEIFVTGGMSHTRTSDKEDLSVQDSSDQAVEGEKKRDKGKGRQIDAMEDQTSQTSHATSQAPSAADPDSDDEAPLADTKPPKTGGAAMQKDQGRRKSQRNVEAARRKAEEEERRKRKLEEPVVENRSVPWRDEKGRLRRGWFVDESEPKEETAVPSNPEPRRRNTEIAQPSTTNKRQSATGYEADKATDTNEIQSPRGTSEGNTGNRDIQNQNTFQQSNQSSENGEAGAPEALNEAIGSYEDSSDPEIPDAYFDQSLTHDTNPRPTNEDDDDDQGEEDDEDNDTWHDGIEAQNPEDAHRFSNRPRSIIKHNDGHRPSTGYGSRHGRSPTSWVERSTMTATTAKPNQLQPARSASPTRPVKPQSPTVSSHRSENDSRDQH